MLSYFILLYSLKKINNNKNAYDMDAYNITEYHNRLKPLQHYNLFLVINLSNNLKNTNIHI